MRLSVLTLAVSAALATAIAPAAAQSAWKTYLIREFGLWFSAPGEIKSERGTYRGQRSGEHPAIIFSSTDNNIEYKTTIVDMNARVGESASLLEEAVVTFQDGKRTVMDNYGRINDLFGRKTTVDLPNGGGRSMASFYFNRGYLYIMQATALPANGDFNAYELARFVDSETFLVRNMEPGAIELRLPPEPPNPPGPG
jgi:hypothetical protein